MIHLNCPVCEYQEIKGNICPNCDTDIFLIRRLKELPLVKKPDSIKLVSGVIVLLCGMGLAILCSYIFVQPIHSIIKSGHLSSINTCWQVVAKVEGAGGEGTARRTFDGFPDQF